LNNESQFFNNLESEKLSYILNPSTPSKVQMYINWVLLKKK